MNKKHLILAPYLPDGTYKTNSRMKWHEKLRVKLAYWLFKSVPTPDDEEIITTT